MILGDRVKFKKSIVKNLYRSTADSVKFAIDKGFAKGKLDDYKDDRYIGGYRPVAKYGVFNHGKALEGVYCGKRVLDMTGRMDCDDGYVFGEKITVCLIATHPMGFHRVPEEFIIAEEWRPAPARDKKGGKYSGILYC